MSLHFNSVYVPSGSKYVVYAVSPSICKSTVLGFDFPSSSNTSIYVFVTSASLFTPSFVNFSSSDETSADVDKTVSKDDENSKDEDKSKETEKTEEAEKILFRFFLVLLHNLILC